MIGEEVDLLEWSIIEVSTAIICASLVSIRPLIAKLIPSLFPTTKAADTKNRTASSGIVAWPSKESSKVSARIRSGNGTVLLSNDDMIIDGNGRVIAKAVVTNRGNDIELGERAELFGMLD
jgi:hypothetical protein